MERFFIISHLGVMLDGPFTSYEAAHAAVSGVKQPTEMPAKIEKFFLCYKADSSICPECIRVIRERGEKAKKGLEMAGRFGAGLKLHANQ